MNKEIMKLKTALDVIYHRSLLNKSSACFIENHIYLVDVKAEDKLFCFDFSTNRLCFTVFRGFRLVL